MASKGSQQPGIHGWSSLQRSPEARTRRIAALGLALAQPGHPHARHLSTQEGTVARAVNRHLLLAMLAIGCVAILTFVSLAAIPLTQTRVISGLTYGLCLFCCGLASLLYDTYRLHPRRPLFRQLDHAAIFLLIAGTCTPFVIAGATPVAGFGAGGSAAFGVGGPAGVPLLAWIWGIALGGIALKLLLRERYETLFVLLYLGMGWLFLSSLYSFAARLPLPAFCLLCAGGAAFSAGTIIYCRRGAWSEAVTEVIWHGFVLAGMLCHFAAIMALTFEPA